MLRIYVKSPPAPVEIVPDYYPVKYGLLYNWWAATDVRNICADGWEVPENSDYDTLITNTTGSALTAGAGLKETGTVYWGGSNVGATNEYNFNARGAGWRIYDDGTFSFFREECNFLTLTVSGDTNYQRRLSMNNVVFGFGNHDKKYGQSIRLIKTTTTLTDGQSGTYTGNDGKVYRTICIGTQEWLADNLCETKFRNGDWIPGFDGGVYTHISNATWAAATTAMCCVYDDDLTNM